MTTEQSKFDAVTRALDTFTTLEADLAVLNAFDRHPTYSGCYDLHDQFTSVSEVMPMLKGVLERMSKIVPDPADKSYLEAPAR